MATTKTGTAIDASGNAIDVTVTSLTNGTLADANDVMATLNDIETDVEGHSHSLDGAVGWDSLLASFAPVDGVDTSNKWALVGGEVKNITLVAGTKSTSITFATDSEQGDPAFTSAPQVTVSCEDSSEECNVTLTSVSTTKANIIVTEINGGTTNSGVGIHFIAYGKVA